ncbi:MAG: hypothetical protein AAF348_02955 [Bacteroidota bacterium]
MKLYRLLSITLLTLSICLVSCSGEDGTDGTNGNDGINGANGANGENGANGKDGTDGGGFDELTKYGNVTMNLKGTRPDGVGLEDSADFKFTPVDIKNEQDSYNTLEITDNNYVFEIWRFLSAPDDIYQDAYLRFYIEINDLGGPEEEIFQISLFINNYAVIGSDNKYFIMDDAHTFTEIQEQEPEFSDFAFDPDTYNFTFSYDFMVDEENNSSSNKIQISGEANVFVKEEIED